MMKDNGRDTARRVVVTGMGAVTPIGLSVEEFWTSALAGRSGGAPITAFDASEWETNFACELKGFDPLDRMDRKLTNRLDPYSQYAIAAADEAMRDAGLDGDVLPEATKERAGVIFGSGI